jgi:vacuolar protein sorting-associated protein 45
VVSGIKKDIEEVVLSSTQDQFFARNRYANFGDLGAAIKEMLDQYQRDSKLNEQITSIEDMQSFMTRYPAFRSQSINVSKHVALMTELARLVDVYRLLDISQLEQEIACANDHSTHKRELLEKLANPSVQTNDKLRLCLLFVLRYESYDETRELKSRLADAGVRPDDLVLLDLIVDYAGEARRAPGLFTGGAAHNTVSGFVSKMSRALNNINGVENVYTQHQPLLSSILEAVSKNKLKDSAYPMVSSAASPASAAASSRVNEIIVYIVGGVTFEEATKVAEFNASNQGMRVMLGGSTIHNSNSFLTEIRKAFGR